MKIPDKVYDVLKWICLVCLPAIIVCWTGLARVWNFPYPEQIAETGAIICTLLGALLGISTAQYYRDKQ